MLVLDRYIIRTICGAVALALAVLLTLAVLFLFLGQQPEVGTGQFGQWQALRFVLFNLPEQALQFLPVAALIGALMGMGSLARGSELTALRAAGVSVGRIGGSMVLAGLMLALTAYILGEHLAPELGEQARRQKALAKYDSIRFADRGGAWVRDGQNLLHAGTRQADGGWNGLLIFELDAQQRVVAVGRADHGLQQGSGQWLLQNHAVTRFDSDPILASRAATGSLRTQLGAEILNLAVADPAKLSLRQLRATLPALTRNGQDTREHRFAYATRFARWVALPLAVLLALPFLFGSLRAAGSGARATMGLVLGLGYFVLQRTVEALATAFALPPAALAWSPVILLGLVVAGLLLRLKLTRVA